jgi:hypothetical protein
MTSWLIYRHGSNAANQSMVQKAAIDVIEADDAWTAKEKAAERHTVYANQWLEAVPEEEADSDDWNAAIESSMAADEMAKLYAEPPDAG